MVSLTVYDGANGIGGNKLYLEEGGKGVLLDFGKNLVPIHTESRDWFVKNFENAILVNEGIPYDF